MDTFIKDVESELGKEAPLSRLRGVLHDYLGMKLDFLQPASVQITMAD